MGHREERGREFREAREALGLTLRQLGERTGLDAATISRIERGEVAYPKEETLARLAAGLGLAPEEPGGEGGSMRNVREDLVLQGLETMLAASGLGDRWGLRKRSEAGEGPPDEEAKALLADFRAMDAGDRRMFVRLAKSIAARKKQE